METKGEFRLMHSQQDRELEIDLIELLREIKKQLPLVILTTLLFAAAAYAYKFVYLPPTYTYTRLVKYPTRTAYGWQIPDQEILSYVVIFRTDMGNAALWKEGGKGRLTAVDFVREKNVATKLIQFQFSGTDPEYIKQVSRKYLESVVQRLNDSFAEANEDEFNHRFYRTANDELRYNNALLGASSASSEGVANYQALLKERLEALEKDKIFLKAKIIEAPNLQPSRVSNRRFVMVVGFLGLFLSLGYIVCRYILIQAKQIGMI